MALVTIIIATADVLIAPQVTKKTQSNIIPTKIHTQKFLDHFFEHLQNITHSIQPGDNY